jgi:hypothetical protein
VIGRRRGRLSAVVLLAVTTAGCTGARGDDVVFSMRSAPTTTSTAAATTISAPPPPPPTTGAPAAIRPPTTPKPTRPPRPRVVHEQAWTPFAIAGGVVTLHHPSSRVERVGFHESNNDGARPLEALPTAADPIDLETRDRGTGGRTAADVVSDPDVEVRAPVSGRVKRAGTYTLYCKYRDDFVVIEPDERPGWEVKVLHIDGEVVHPGDRVVAGETVLAPRPTKLPFASQVDETTASPPWPHVHIEVVDPSIPDRPGPGC